jgi:Holin of 3TMs, for gene-transfer release
MDPLSLVAIGGKLLDKLSDYFPSPEKKAQAQLALMEMAQKGELAHLDAEFNLAKGQLDVNKTEAASEHLFVSGWRPAIGWVCGLAFFTQFVLGPAISYIAISVGHPVSFPKFDFGEMMPILLGMLGLGSMRTVEKIKGN